MDSFMETHFHNNNQQTNSGLLRFRSAPSSLFDDVTQNLTTTTNNGFSGSGSGLGLGLDRLPPQYPRPNLVTSGSSSSSIQPSNSIKMNILNRQNSSPAGFFSNLIPPNGYTMMRGIGNFRVGNGTDDSTSKLSMSHLPQIPEIGTENVKETNPDDDARFDRSTGFSFSSWNEPNSEASHPSQNGGLSIRSNVLSHHLSLPKTSAELATVEKLTHFQDTVPWKIRAKRGCATHPRSIAERVRRNRISEKMRKLQGLVPNMDKQTNTADMLDLAVEYIKNLQDQYKDLTDNRARCKCVNLKHSTTNQVT